MLILSDSQLRPVVEKDVAYKFDKNVIINSTPGGRFEHVSMKLPNKKELVSKRGILISDIVTVIGTHDVSM